MQIFNAQQFLLDNNIPIAGASDRHFTDGWVHTRCPFCGDRSNHLGYNLSQGYFNCWRCGFHSTYDVIKALIGSSRSETYSLLKQYNAGEIEVLKHNKIKASSCEFPKGTGELQDYHKRYLIHRGFNPDEIQSIWGIKATAFNSSEPFRIIVPIYYEDELVSYQGRTVDKRQPLRYLTCASDREVLDHKNLLYGLDYAKVNPVCIVVEGVFDAWKLGIGAVATFGIKFKTQQVQLLSKHFSKVYIMYDPEPIAQQQAQKLKAELNIRGIRVEILNCPASDPADLTKEQVKKIRENIF